MATTITMNVEDGESPYCAYNEFMYNPQANLPMHEDSDPSDAVQAIDIFLDARPPANHAAAQAQNSRRHAVEAVISPELASTDPPPPHHGLYFSNVILPCLAAALAVSN